MRIVMTILLTAGIVFGIGSAIRHRHGCGFDGHHGWRDHHHHGAERQSGSAATPAPEQPK